MKSLPNKLYDAMKYLSMVALTALGNAYEQIAAVWGLPYGNQVMRTCSVIAACLGALACLSTISYNKEQAEMDRLGVPAAGKDGAE